MGKYRSRKKQKQSTKSTKSNSLSKLNNLNNLRGGVRLQTIFEAIDQDSAAQEFDLMSHYFNDSLSVDAVLNPSDFIGEISLIKEKIGSRKSEARVFSLTGQDLRWKTGIGSKLRTLIGKRGVKGVIRYEDIMTLSPSLLISDDNRQSFIVSKQSRGRTESYKLI